MDKDTNIIHQFLKTLLFTIVLLSIISIVLLYISEQNKFHKSIAQDIAKHVSMGLSSNNINLLSKEFIHHVKMIDFALFELYDANKKEIFSFVKDKNTNHFIDEIKQQNQNTKSVFSINEETNFNYFKISNDQFYMFIYTPIYKNNKTIGYISGIKKIDNKLIEQFEDSVLHIIFLITLSILFFALTLFPIIYFAYKKLKRNKLNLIQTNIMTIHTLGNAVALRDSDTDEHNYRVTIYSVQLAQVLHMSKREVQEIIIGAFLHDIGKIGIEDSILLKNTKLSNDEFAKMKEHVNKGIQIIKKNQWLERGKNIILCHHEKYDGSGYPNGIKGENIPKIARLFAIIDVFDALTSKRPYKEPFSYDKAIRILKESGGSHFDPAILDTFLSISSNLYNSINHNTHPQLQDKLDALIIKYFLDTNNNQRGING